MQNYIHGKEAYRNSIPPVVIPGDVRAFTASHRNRGSQFIKKKIETLNSDGIGNIGGIDHTPMILLKFDCEEL